MIGERPSKDQCCEAMDAAANMCYQDTEVTRFCVGLSLLCSLRTFRPAQKWARSRLHV